MSNLKITIFTDGASSGNPGPGGWGVVIVYPPGITHSQSTVEELGGFAPSVTNNQMELGATIRALEALPDRADVPLEIYTDSTYVILGITQWIWGWMKRGWVTAEGKEVANTDLWKRLFQLVKNKKIDWKYIPGHSGFPGNERTDQIAVSFSQRQGVKLYQGGLVQYPLDLSQVPQDTSLPEMKSPKAKSKPVSYLSLVGSTPMRHASWDECQRRVKGVSGAKFKKAMNELEEVEILKGWGVKPTDIK
jgi:ribonuclease HI